MSVTWVLPVTSDQLNAHLTQRIDRLRAATRDIGQLERQLAAARDRHHELIAELYGLVPVAELVAVTNLTRQHLHRLARRERTGGA
jgi:hypothetical protein